MTVNRITLALALMSFGAAAAAATEVRATYVTADEIATEWVGIAASPNKRVFAIPSLRRLLAMRPGSNVNRSRVGRAPQSPCQIRGMPSS